MWPLVREFVGNLWGKATTLSLGIGVAVLAVPLPPNLAVPDWLRWGLFGVAVGVSVLRQVAPPPPSVSIQTNDHVDVSPSGKTVTIIKADGVPDNVTSKTAGEPVSP